MREQFDHIVVATYSGLNDVLVRLGLERTRYRFQVAEKLIALLPPAFAGTSIVVIDGPFGCADPLDDTPLHVLGHVVETVHPANTALAPDVPEHLAPLIDAGLIRNPPFTRFPRVVEDLARYIPGTEAAVHVGSMFTIRAVLAHQEATDTRPTLVERLDHQVIRVFSGKLGTAVAAAERALQLMGCAVATEASAFAEAMEERVGG